MLLRYPGLVLYVALVSPLTAQEPPPYPYALPDWYEQTDRKLKSIRVSLDFVDVPLQDCLSDIFERYGVKIRTDPSVKEKENPITLNIRDLRLVDAIKIVAGLRNLSFRVTDDAGVVLTRTPEAYSVPDFVVIRKKIDVIRRNLPYEESKERVEPPIDLLATPVSFRYQKTPLIEVIIDLKQRHGINIVLSRQAAREVGEPLLTATAEKLPLGEALPLLLAPYGLDAEVHQGVLFIQTAARVRDLRAKRAEDQERLRVRKEAVIRHLQRTCPDDLGGQRVPAIARTLGRALDLPVHPSPRAWHSTHTLSGSTAGWSLEKISQGLARTGLRMVVKHDAIYLVEGPSDDR